jgi:hypothetical protein
MRPQNSGKATAALVVGIAGMVLFCFLASPVALGLGLSAVKDIDRSGGRLGGRSQATAGWILGLIGTICLVGVIALIIVAAATDSSSSDSSGLFVGAALASLH